MLEQAFGEAVRNFAMPLPHPRMAIYRNNIASALIHALRVRYPATETIAGHAAFAALAGSYALANLPTDPVLIHYGGSFPEFIATSETSEELPLLADVALLESLWWKAYHAAEAEPLVAACLNALPPEELFDLVFQFHPSLAVMTSPFAVGSVWQACKQKSSWREHLDGEGERLIVARPRAEVHVKKVGPAAHVFLSHLMQGMALGPAYEILAATHADFDLNHELSALIQSEIMIGIAE